MSTESAAHHLLGKRLADGWTVIEKIPERAGKTGGVFSVSYKVQHDDGELGFCKALDFAQAFEDKDPTRELKRLVDLYEFERDLLYKCGKKRMNRVVRVLTAGTIRLSGFNPEAVSYLILELADGDAHDLREESDPADCLPGLGASHNAAVGLSQLHSLGVVHQDVKPSNLLTWRGQDVAAWESKIGDVGSAFDRVLESPTDAEILPGDPSYAAPETLYPGADLPPDWRRAAEMYTFGNLVCFLTTGLPFSGLQLGLFLDKEFHWRRCDIPWPDLLPCLVESHGRAIEVLRRALHKEVAGPLTELISELCYPDPLRRGDSIARRRNQNPYQLERYITRIKLLIFRVELARAKDN